MRFFLKISLIVISMFYLSTVLVSNAIYSSNYLAFATFENSNIKISDSIKKACPSYEDNGTIKGLISDLIKACLNEREVSEPQPNPNPNTEPFPRNILTFHASAGTTEEIILNATIVITDTTSDFSNSYLLTPSDIVPQSTSDTFVIPIGDNYRVNVTVSTIPGPSLPDRPNYTISFDSGSCQLVTETMCTGTMGSSGNSIDIDIRATQPE